MTAPAKVEQRHPFKIEAESERLETMYEYRVVRPNGVGGSVSYGSTEDAEEEVRLLAEGYEFGLADGYKRAVASIMENPDFAPESLAAKLVQRGREDERERECSPAMIEVLSAIEHGQWMQWAQSVMDTEQGLSSDRRARWASLMVPYAELSEDMKEHDRKWARKVVDAVLADRRGRK